MSAGSTYGVSTFLVDSIGAKGDFKNPLEAVGDTQLCFGLSVPSVFSELLRFISSRRWF